MVKYHDQIRSITMKRTVDTINSSSTEVEYQHKKPSLRSSELRVSHHYRISERADNHLTSVTTADYHTMHAPSAINALNGSETPSSETDSECASIDREAISRHEILSDLRSAQQIRMRKVVSAPTVTQQSRDSKTDDHTFFSIENQRSARIFPSLRPQSLPKRSGSTCLNSLADMTDMSTALDEITFSDSTHSSELYLPSDSSDNESEGDHSIGLMI